MFIGLLLYGLIHSLLASHRAKSQFERTFGSRAYHGLYRLIFNLIATMSFIPYLLLLIVAPSTIVWSVDGAIAFVLRAIQLLGLIGLTLSLLQIDLGEFAGLTQLRAYLHGESLPLALRPLQVRGIYRWFRHPLYLFAMLVLWAQPLMTDVMLSFVLGCSLYFIIGSRYEEKRLLATYGEHYSTYLKRVGWIGPALRPPGTIP
ncbi:MAG: DUF1295 domain-containing protein [Aggregatilineales bacterium]